MKMMTYHSSKMSDDEDDDWYMCASNVEEGQDNHYRKSEVTLPRCHLQSVFLFNSSLHPRRGAR